jgi:predicted ATPase/DNA-binding winged helix-turn-helix (wHTH) protein
MAEQHAKGGLVLSFGRFELSPGERLLTADGAPVELGARALDTLIALASRPNEVVGKRELMALIWPDATVEEGSLRFHIASLRKALGDGKDGARYIATLAGRGYCFVAPVARSGGPGAGVAMAEIASPRVTFLPARLARMVGREDSVGTIAADLVESRFVTIVGPGGVGKTTVAVAVAHDLLPTFDGAALFVDFSLLSEARTVPSSVASMLGISIQSDDPVPSLISYLRDKRMIVVLDNCEHVVDAAAQLAARLFLAAPGLSILATSREALRVEGERVHRLAPLAVPPDDPALKAAAALKFPAARLFVERATASGARLELDDGNAAILASICRKLDGMALAIELAAGRVEAYGLRRTAALLDERLALLWPGQRTAPARQKTLRATLDWSYGLLPEPERIVFRRLAAFVGSFSIEAALAVVTSETIDAAGVFAAKDSLVAKSMVTAFPEGAMMHYRLLDTARAYAIELSVDSAERAELAARHAAYCLGWLKQLMADGQPLLAAAERAPVLVGLNNVRAALEWCFADAGDVGLGLNLAVSAAPVFFAMSLLTECHHWSHRAILAIDDARAGGRVEMRLRAALGLSLMWTRGNSEPTLAALNRSIAIARRLEDPLNQILLLAPLHVFHMRIGEFGPAMRYAEKVVELARTTDDSAAVGLSRILLGFSLHFAGDLAGARRELEAATRWSPDREQTYERSPVGSATMWDDAMAAPILALASSAAPSALARTLWLQGHPAAAMRYVGQTIADAASSNHPVRLLVALIHAISVLVWSGDFDGAEEQIARFIKNADSHALESHVVLGRCFEAQLMIGRGDPENGVATLHPRLQELHARRYELLTTAFQLSLAQGLGAVGRGHEGLALIDDAIRSVEVNGDFCYMPELLRVKAALLLAVPERMDKEAELCLAASLAWSHRQGARAWALRTAIDLAAMRVRQDRSADARAVLQPVFATFTDGFGTADLRAAERLLASLKSAAKA